MIIANTPFINEKSQIIVRIGKFQRMVILPYLETFTHQKYGMLLALKELMEKIQRLEEDDEY